MSYKELKCIDALLKLIRNDLKLDFSYKIICKWKNQLVTLDFVLPFYWNDEFYLSEPKTISSLSDEKEKVYMEITSQYSVLKDNFKFKQLINHYKKQETNCLILYLLENNSFYDFDVEYFDYAYDLESLDKSWCIPMVKIDNDIEFISLQLVKHEQN
ncbi:hypothetical protein [Staphylococcus felis]|uniref:Uncharacterized protein n=1 Tax=Staphylococcus felis TaxID=46127 RepID=A0ABS0QRD8_9STAP|nr:hypothetical protein [Staphylococcus felis]MBH9581758.1 hypothetical protein [Staphylococcus felis]